MSGSDRSRNNLSLETSLQVGTAPLESILCTEELRSRPRRRADYEKESRALGELASALADSPRTIFRTLADTIRGITECDSAGLSLLTNDGKTPHVGGKRFYWPAIVGMWAPHVGGGTPREFGPCGDVLDQNRTLLFRHFERRYPYLVPVIPAAEECLLVPFYVAGKAVGTIWAIMHSTRRKFDAEDERIMTSLGKFTASAYQALTQIEALKVQVYEREKAEAEVRVARAVSLGTLAASIAHELNQPLSGIVTNASTCRRMLAAAPPNIQGALEALRRTSRDANRASEVISRLRALFSRKGTATESVDLSEAAREVIELSLSELKTHQVVVRAELAKDLIPIRADRVQIQQVILNLIRNAAEAMSAVYDRPRELLIRTEQFNGDQVRVSVADSGVGLPSRDANRLFEAFFTTKKNGMGIGLSVSRSIIERHHGRIWAANNDGPGSTFSFSIPCRQEVGSGSSLLGLDLNFGQETRLRVDHETAHGSL